MKTGIPKEIKSQENRVAITPAGVKSLTEKGHQVTIQKSAGSGSGYEDPLYESAGAHLADTPGEVFNSSELILKVKEPIEEEYQYFHRNHVLFSYFHFASNPKLISVMQEAKSACIAYETVTEANGFMPLLFPMSEIAGRMASQEGAKYLEKPFGGKGKLMGGIAGIGPAKVMILGAGTVGYQAAKVASGMGAEVFLLDKNLKRLRELQEMMPLNVQCLYSETNLINNLIKEVDIIIGAVHTAGRKAPKLITRSMLGEMEPGTVLIDVAVDQGGCIETCEPTTHDHPTYIIDGILHYCVANMPGAVPHTATQSLTQSTLPYIHRIADHGWKHACKADPGLAEGVNMLRGKITHKGLAESVNMPFYPLEEVMAEMEGEWI